MHQDGRHPFGDGDQAGQRLAALQDRQNVAVAGAGGDDEFARLDRLAAAKYLGPRQKSVCRQHRARPLEQHCRVGERRPLRHHDADILFRRALLGPARDEAEGDKGSDGQADQQNDTAELLHRICAGSSRHHYNRPIRSKRISITAKFSPARRGLSHMERTSFYFVMLNLFQNPFLVTSGGSWGAMDPETSSG